MDAHVFSLSGDFIATLKASPSDIVADLKAKLSKNTDDSSPYDMKLLLDGACLTDDQRWGELQRHGPPVHLRAIWLLKPAREILFSCSKVAGQLAKHYDSLGEQCTEGISSLFLDSHGIPRSQLATIEVLVALRDKLSKHPGLECLKASLTEIALRVLQTVEDLDSSYVTHLIGCLVGCFVWLGLPAAETLLDQLLSHKLPCDVSTLVRPKLTAAFAALPSVDEVLGQLPHGCGEAHIELRMIVERAATPCQPPLVIDGAGARAVLSTGKEVLAALCQGDCEELHQEKLGVELRTREGGVVCRALLDAVLSAVEQEPQLVAPRVRGLPLALGAVQRCAGCFCQLPESLRMERKLLHAALARDPDLQAEFMETASASEIHQWKWHVQEAAPPRRKRR